MGKIITGARMDALVRGADWAGNGREAPVLALEPVAMVQTRAGETAL